MDGRRRRPLGRAGRREFGHLRVLPTPVRWRCGGSSHRLRTRLGRGPAGGLRTVPGLAALGETPQNRSRQSGRRRAAAERDRSPSRAPHSPAEPRLSRHRRCCHTHPITPSSRAACTLLGEPLHGFVLTLQPGKSHGRPAKVRLEAHRRLTAYPACVRPEGLSQSAYRGPAPGRQASSGIFCPEEQAVPPFAAPRAG